MGKDKDEFINLKEGESMLPESTYNRTVAEANASRKKFHLEAGVWFCNTCNDIGREKDNKLVCQGCQSSE